MPGTLAGRTAIITGTGSGIGKAAALLFAERGARVIGLGPAESGTDETVAEIRSAGGSAERIEVDLRDPEQVEHAVRQIHDLTDRIDVLVHVAGMSLYTHSAEVSWQKWDEVMALNARAPFLLTRDLMPDLISTKGTVLAVASITGMQGWAYSSVYSASKGALIANMRSLAVEYGSFGVRVNIVAPGSIVTPMVISGGTLPNSDVSIEKRRTGLTGRRGEAHEVATALAFFASDDASFISGAVLPIDGGAFA